MLPKLALVVEDEVTVRSLVATILAEEGYEVFEAANGRIALGILAQRRFDLVVCDVKMPEVGGRALYERLEITAPGLTARIVMITGANNSDADYFLKKSVPLLRKPFSRLTLVNTVLAVESRPLHSPSA